MKTDETIDAFVSRLNAASIPVRANDNATALTTLEARMPRRMARSFESFLRRYSFPAFDICGVTLFGWNSEWQSTEYFTATSTAKKHLSFLLLPAGLMQIGRPDTGNFDAVCLDLNSGDEQRVIRVDHEEILCNWRVKVVDEVWPSFLTVVNRLLSGVECGLHYDEMPE